MTLKDLKSDDVVAIVLGLVVCCLFAFFYIKVGLGFYENLSKKTKDRLKGNF
ncbi:MAG TPA: hypothetical protein VIK86_00345 [Candidatus Paceibacterota bacterium]